MRPTLLSVEIGGLVLRLPSYGLAVGIGMTVAIVLAARQARREGLEVARILDLAFLLLVGGLAGSRLSYVAVNAGDFVRLCAGTGGTGHTGGVTDAAGARGVGQTLWDCTAVLRFWDGGLVFYGGLLAALVITFAFVRRRGWRFGQVTDVFVPGVALGHAIGRLGCFLAGCCFGKVCQAGAGFPCVSFPAGSVAHAHLAPTSATTPPLHATQLYELAAEIALFAVLLALRRRRPFTGAITLAYLLGYALLRLSIEVFRGDEQRRFLFEVALPRLAQTLGLPPSAPLLLSTSQAVSLALIVTSGVLLWRVAPRQRS